MAVRDRSRKTEGMLSVGVVLVLAVALLLVGLAKWRTPVPADAVALNAATPEALARLLDVDNDLAVRLTQYRDGLGGFESVEQLLDTPLFTRAEADRVTAQLAATHFDPRAATVIRATHALDVKPAVARRLLTWLLARETPPAPLTSPPDSKKKPPLAAGKPPAPTPAPPTTAPLKIDLPAPNLRTLPLLDAAQTRPLLQRLLVRSPTQTFRNFGLGALVLCLAVFLVPPWLRRRVEGDPYLVPLVLLLTGLGVAMLFSIKDPFRDGPAFLHHLQGLALALIAMTTAARLAPQTRLRLNNYRYVWVLAAIALVVALFLFGSGPEGVKLNLFHFQPVELIKLLLVLFLASYLSARADLIADASPRWKPPLRANARKSRAVANLPRVHDVAPLLVMFAVALALFYVIRDLGPGVLLFGVCVAMLYLTTGRGLFVAAGLALLCVGAFLGYQAHVGVFATRVDMWLHPFANAHPNGMQLAQGYWGLASGGVEGSGLGLGMPGLIPRAGSDLAFVSWVEETGLTGAWLVLTVYAVLVWRGLRIALRASNDFDRALAFGLSALLGLQTLLIVGGVTGLIPLTGISLPFLSYGNSALVADFVIVGLLRALSAPPPGGVGRPAPRPETLVATRRFAFAFVLTLLGVVGLWRLGRMTLLQADELAVATVTTPDADKVARPHQNPRLLAMERDIVRGSIYDRVGRVVATSRPDEIGKSVADVRQRERLIDRRARWYPFGAVMAHPVGYFDSAVGGPTGLERRYNADLRGWTRLTDLLTDYRQRHSLGFQPRAGRDLHLTLDAVLQRDAQTILFATATKLRDTRDGKPKDRAAFVLMVPQTGDVVVAVSIPTFDPNGLTPERMRAYLTGPDEAEEHRLIDRALSGVYPPGSTLKIATAACALDSVPDIATFSVVCNQVSPDIHWLAGGTSHFRGGVRDDIGDPSFGPLTLAPAFRVSSNIYFANLAARIGAQTFRQTLADKMSFRYAPSQADFDADLPDIGYGQGPMLATPLEMARLAASSANDGVMMQARFVSSLTDPTGRAPKDTRTPTTLSQAMTRNTAQTLRGLMRSVVTNGTARGVFNDLDVAVAGKTGTAQNLQYDREPHSWFVGVAPYASGVGLPPRFAFACVVENGGYGKRVAAVICRDVLRRAFR